MKCVACVLLAAACGDNGPLSYDEPAVDALESVLELHGSPSRAGAYRAPALTRAAAAGLQVDPTFSATYLGNAYAQPLYYDGPDDDDLFIVATETNQVAAFRPSGVEAWRTVLGAPQPMPNPDEEAPCGNINPLGITGTPVIDYAHRTLFLDAMIREDDHAHHRIFALSLDDGGVLPGWPVDPGAQLTGPFPFTPAVQNQRGGLTYFRGRVYVPYGGHAGDCGPYRGWVVSVPRTDPDRAAGFATRAFESGSWMPGGVTSDGASVFAVFGNAVIDDEWADGDMVARLGDGATFTRKPEDFWVPTNWHDLDVDDVDLTGPAMPFELEGSSPSSLLLATGKDHFVYLLDRTNLGGIADPIASIRATTNEIISVSAIYRTARGTYVVLRGHGVEGCPGLDPNSSLVALRVEPGAPPRLSLAWCAGAGLTGSPIATSTDGTADPIVWAFGAQGDQRLHGFDGDTGETVYAGGGPDDAAMASSRFISPIYARGKLYVATSGRLMSWTP